MKFGVWELVIIAVIVLLLFGTKKLRNAGGDIGAAMKNFKKAVKDEETASVEDKNEDGKDADFTSTQDRMKNDKVNK